MITYKVKHKNFISNLYLPKQKSGRVVLLLQGLPLSTNTDKLVNTLLSTGAVVYYPNFSGVFDSGGIFNAKNAIKDVAQLHNLIIKPNVKELYFGKNIEIGKINEAIIVGNSFSSIVALLGHKNKYDKMILLSSALLFNPKDFPTKDLGKNFYEQMKSLLSLLKNAFPYSYRTGGNSDLKNFLIGKSSLSQKKTVIDAFNNLKIPTLVVHGRGDTSINLEIIKSIQNDVDNPNVVWVYTDSTHSINSYKENALKVIRDFILK
jgi:esterase/lipase